MRERSVVLLVSWMLLSAVAPQAAGDCPSSPVPFYRPLPQAPGSSAGTSLAPVVRVRIAVDQQGRVSSVDVLSVEPSGPLDKDYSDVARKTLLRWRFRAACKDGRPVPGTIEWSIQFPRLQTKPSERSDDLDDLLMPLQGKSARHAAILSLPKVQLDHYREEIVRKARSCLHGPPQTAQRAGVTVITDSPQPGAAQNLLQVILAAQRAAYDLFSAKIPPYPAKTPLYAFLYRERSSYRELADKVETFDFSGGFYSPAGVLATYLETSEPDVILALIVHETTHSFMDRFLFLPRTRKPVWLSEGFAQYMENSDIRDGKLVPGGHEQKWMHRKIFLTRDGVYTTAPGLSASWADAKEVKKAMKEGKALSLSELVNADREVFYGPKRRLFYTESWILVHFLRHGRPEWADQAFPAFMLYVAEGYPAREAILAEYGRDPEKMDAEFRDYVLHF